MKHQKYRGALFAESASGIQKHRPLFATETSEKVRVTDLRQTLATQRDADKLVSEKPRAIRSSNGDLMKHNMISCFTHPVPVMNEEWRRYVKTRLMKIQLATMHI